MHRHYNRYNQHRMTLNTVGFEPAVFNPIEFKPVEADYNILERSFAKQEERKQKAIAQQSAVQAAIANVELDASEDSWKQDYINNINNQINAATEVGDYAGALETATRLAGDVASDPALLGRERYNKERQEWLRKIENKRTKGLISDDSYERAIAQNTYNYKDIKDNNGNIVGGSKWTPEFNPLNDIDLGSVLAEMQTFMGVSSESGGSGGGTTQQYYDINGQITDDPNKAVSVRSITKGGSTSYSNKEVTVNDWRKAYDAYIARHPEDEARLNQLWENARYNFSALTNRANDETLSQEDRVEAQRRADSFWSSLTDNQGGLITKDDWILQRISPSFGVMAYRQHSYVTEEGSTLLDENTLKNRVIAGSMGLNYEQAELYASGAPMRVVLAEDATRRQEIYTKGNNTIDAIEGQVDE